MVSNMIESAASSTEVPVIELSSPPSPRQARHTLLPRACFEIYPLIPLFATAHNSSPAEGLVAAKYRNLPEVVNSPGSEPTAPGARSLSRVVPALVPSLPHSSEPCLPSAAAKSSTPPNTVNESGLEAILSGLISLTTLVPFTVPSLFHNSTPCLPSFAVKKSHLPSATRLPVSDASDLELGWMFLTSLVPLLVPPLFHSSTPCLPSFAVKNIVLPTSVMSSAHELPRQLFSPLHASVVGAGAAVLMFLTSLVPLLVPSLFHSSTPCLPSFALK